MLANNDIIRKTIVECGGQWKWNCDKTIRDNKKMNGHLNLLLCHQSTSPEFQVSDGASRREIALSGVMKWLKVKRYKDEVHGRSFQQRASCTLGVTVLSTGMSTCRC